MTNNTNEIEQAIIGLIFQYDSLNEKINGLSEDDFQISEYRNIFIEIEKVYKKYGTVDRAIILDSLKQDQRIILVACAEKAIAPSMFDCYAELLKSSAQQARLIRKFEELRFTDECTIDNLQKLIDEEQQSGFIFNAEQKAKSNINSFIDQLGKEKDLLKTGFSDIDFYTRGLERGTLFIIGARPSTGKTTFALNIASKQVKKGRKVLIFSLEMTAKMIYERILSDRLNINYSDFSFKSRINNYIDEIKTEMQIFEQDGNLLVLDDVYTIESICNQIMEVKPDIVVVDFIQIVDSVKKYDDTRTKINYISAELKRVAKKTGCIVIALSQLTRSGKDAPTMSDLRESGALEQDGDYIVILHRAYVSDKQKADESETQVLFDKNKFGWTGLLHYRFNGIYQRFTEQSDCEEPIQLSTSAKNDLPFW